MDRKKHRVHKYYTEVNYFIIAFFALDKAAVEMY